MIITLKHFPYKITKRRCYICGKIKKVSEFSKDITRAGGIGYKCKKCNNANVYRYKNKFKKI